MCNFHEYLIICWKSYTTGYSDYVTLCHFSLGTIEEKNQWGNQPTNTAFNNL